MNSSCILNHHDEQNSVSEPQYLCTVVVIFWRSLHEAETVDVADVRLPVGSQQVEAADVLLGGSFYRSPLIDRRVSIIININYILKILHLGDNNPHVKRVANIRELPINNRHTLKARQTVLAIIFSLADSRTGYLISFPSLSRSTFPSRAGDFRASAWA